MRITYCVSYARTLLVLGEEMRHLPSTQPLLVPTPMPLPCCLALIPSGLLPADRKHKNTRRLNHNHSSDYLHNASYTSFVFAPAACERALRGLHIDGKREGAGEWKEMHNIIVIIITCFLWHLFMIIITFISSKIMPTSWRGHYRVLCSRAGVTSSHLAHWLTKTYTRLVLYNANSTRLSSGINLFVSLLVSGFGVF